MRERDIYRCAMYFVPASVASPPYLVNIEYKPHVHSSNQPLDEVRLAWIIVGGVDRIWCSASFFASQSA